MIQKEVVKIKAVWKGEVSFGLVSIPVELFSAVESKLIEFHLLHNKCKNRLHYKRWCAQCNKEVAWKDVVRGFEIVKNKFYVLTPEKLEKLKSEKTGTIEVKEFIDLHQIDPIYFNKHYFLVPQRAKEKAYWLFKEVLMASAKIAVGNFVMRDKEHICAIESYKEGLLLTTLNFVEEVRDINKIEVLQEKAKLGKKELELAKGLINKLTKKEFKIEVFKESFSEELKELIRKELKGEKIKAKKKEKKPALMEALRMSMGR